MNWVLIINGLLMQTEMNLQQCREHFSQAVITPSIKDVYCQSTQGDRVWLMRDGKFFVIPKDDE